MSYNQYEEEEEEENEYYDERGIEYEDEEEESGEDEEEVEALGDALELNKKLKMIMSSNLDPVSMQQQLTALMGQMEGGGGGGGGNPNQQQQQRNHPKQQQQQQQQQKQQQQQQRHHPHPQQQQQQQHPQRKPLGGMSHNSNMKQAMKSANSGKTFSSREAMAQQKNNQMLLKKMIKIQTTPSSNNNSIGGYQGTSSNHAHLTNFKSSNTINRQKKMSKIAGDNQKFLSRLQNVKSTMNTKKMRADADRNAQISKMRSQVHVQKKRSVEGGRRPAPGANNMFGNAANQARMSRFKAPPSMKQPDWEG